jgi:UDP-N-acetylmuramate: L-alanyl-gamma-D-glutamyl-meso-diaminopimelate ligase
MHVHLLGICGTFMGGLAFIARQLGYDVTGSDAHVYPPMSTQLQSAGIDIIEGYDTDQLQPVPDQVIIGNAMKRGVPIVEFVLNNRIPYCSGPQWLAEHVLSKQTVLGVAGTHGKTTTASILTWILETAGLNPGFLIGGVPCNFNHSARLGAGQYFVIEADEYDTAFFDKRSKFIHYQPQILILNNLEFDHADIFDNLTAIQRQFHHLIRTIPGNGMILYPSDDLALHEVLTWGCWTPTATLAFSNPHGGKWAVRIQSTDQSGLEFFNDGQLLGTTHWSLWGWHNARNALAAVAAAIQIGVAPDQAIAALASFSGVRRRLELRGEQHGVRVYDDFAHHPTAIAATIEGLRQATSPSARILAVVEPRSNTMRLGIHAKALVEAFANAHHVYILVTDHLAWNVQQTLAPLNERLTIVSSTQAALDALLATVRAGDHVLIMSNGAVDQLHQRLLDQLAARTP